MRNYFGAFATIQRRRATISGPSGRSSQAGRPVGEYRYHRSFPAYANFRANALLGLDGSLGHVTEVLSGSYYQSLATSSPHQIWSAAMVVSPLLRRHVGLRADVTKGNRRFRTAHTRRLDFLRD